MLHPNVGKVIIFSSAIVSTILGMLISRVGRRHGRSNLLGGQALNNLMLVKDQGITWIFNKKVQVGKEEEIKGALFLGVTQLKLCSMWKMVRAWHVGLQWNYMGNKIAWTPYIRSFADSSFHSSHMSDWSNLLVGYDFFVWVSIFDHWS